MMGTGGLVGGEQPGGGEAWACDAADEVDGEGMGVLLLVEELPPVEVATSRNGLPEDASDS